MICQGYECSTHEVERLHGKGLCNACYMRKYRQEHIIELRAYQQDYCADQGYRDARRIYMRAYRKAKKHDTT
jgi:hypothetical protein